MRRGTRGRGILRPPTCQKYFLDKLKRKAVTMPSPAFCFFAASAVGRLCAAGLIAGNVAASRFLSCRAQNPLISAFPAIYDRAPSPFLSQRERKHRSFAKGVNCLTEPFLLVNGGQSPFVLTIDEHKRLWYLSESGKIRKLMIKCT